MRASGDEDQLVVPGANGLRHSIYEKNLLCPQCYRFPGFSAYEGCPHCGGRKISSPTDRSLFVLWGDLPDFIKMAVIEHYRGLENDRRDAERVSVSGGEGDADAGV